MRVAKLTIKEWRHIRNVTIEPDPNGKVICLVGENGSGKSSIMELLSECLKLIGVDHGNEPPRGRYLYEPHEVELLLDFSDQLDQLRSLNILEVLGQRWGHQGSMLDWDGRIGFHSMNEEGKSPVRTIELDGHLYHENQWRGFTTEFMEANAIKHLLLDSNRVYSKIDQNWLAYHDGIGPIWSAQIQHSLAYRSTKDLFENWQRYMLTEQLSAAEKLGKDISLASIGGQQQVLQFADYDPFTTYKDMVNRALPHLKFLSPDVTNRSLRFWSHSREVDFFQLSGGEREICYLLGQVVRFDLLQGILLVDEPELHLHPSLIDRWITFLLTELVQGQIWFATHSYEVVDAVGLENVFALEPDENGYTVTTEQRIGTTDLGSQIFRITGVPGLSLMGKTLLMVESGGEEQARDRQRYSRLLDKDPKVLILPIDGGKKEVIGNMKSFRHLENLTGGYMRFKGIVDSDFESLKAPAYDQGPDLSLFVLPTHEIENLFLHPDSLSAIAERNGRSDFNWVDSVGREMDQIAGKWVHGCAISGNFHEWNGLLGIDEIKRLKSAWSKLSLARIDEQDHMILLRGLSPQIQSSYVEAIDKYRDSRLGTDWWKHLLGKEVLPSVHKYLDFRTQNALELNLIELWKSNASVVPNVLVDVRGFVAGDVMGIESAV